MKLPDLSGPLFAPHSIKWFRWAIAMAALVNAMILLPLYLRKVPLNEAVLPLPGRGWFFQITHLLQDAEPVWALIFVGLNAISALLLLWVRWRIPACLMLLFTGHNLVGQCYPYLNMSQYLLLALCTYLLFMDERADKWQGFTGQLSRGLTNAFFIICWAQVLAAYVFPFFYKAQGPMWWDGSALGTILAIPEFSRGFLLSIAQSDHWLFKLLTWSTLIYQAAFPILIWWRKAKPYMILAGVCFNLGIGAFMGLMDIAVVMVAAYAILLDEATLNEMRAWLPGFRKQIEADLASSA